MYCRKCGEEIEDDSTYCKYCGEPVEKEPIPGFRPRVRNWMNIFWIVVLVIALAVMVSTFADYYRKPEAEPEPTYQERVADLSQSVLLVNVYDRDKNLLKTGSGFVMFNDETLVTNFHVIKDAYAVEAVDNTDAVYSIDGAYCYDVAQDIAILRFSAPSGLPVLEMGDSDAVQVGDEVTAIGSPLGLKNTVSKGIISAVRQCEIQITAPISPGSSGGALFDEAGKVLGVTYAGMVGGENLNLVIPAKEVVQIREENQAGESTDFVIISNKLPIINETNRGYVEQYLSSKGKCIVPKDLQKDRNYFDSLPGLAEALNSRGLYYGVKPIPQIIATDVIDTIRFGDIEEQKIVNMVDDRISDGDTITDNELLAMSAIKDNVRVIKINGASSSKNFAESWQALEQGTKRLSPDTYAVDDAYAEYGWSGPYVYKIGCKSEDIEYYQTLVRYLIG